MRNDSRLGRLIKIAAAFLQGENSELFKTKFGGEGDEEEVKDLARRFYAIFGTWTDYEAYRALVGSKNNIVEMKDFISKCEDKLASVKRIITELNLGIQDRAIDDLGRQYLRKYVAEIDSDSFLSRLRELNKVEGRTGEDLYELLRNEKRKNRDAKVESPEFEGKDLSGIESYKDWMLKIKNSGEAHSMDDIISLVRTFLKMNARSAEKKNINDFSSYSELQRYLDDQSFVDKDAYISSIAVPATQNDMSKIIYEDERWKVVLIGSTIGGQWWGQGTDFCISRLENNLYSTYARTTDPYFIIDKAAASSDPMRKFTVAIKYDEDGNYEINQDSSTMTNASNIGISIGDIERALDGKWGMIKQKIMEESGSRKSSMGTANKTRIKKIIDDQDLGNAKLYEKEIAADEELSKKFLYGVNLNNHAQYHGLISEIVKKKPYDFLENFSKESWAAPYIDVAAKAYAEEDPHYFLVSHSEMPWAKQLTESIGGKTWEEFAGEKLAEKDPAWFLKHFSKEPWATPYIDIAAKIYVERDPANFLHYFSKMSWANKPVESIEGKTWVQFVAKIYAESDPANFLKYFSKEPWAAPYIDGAAKALIEKDSGWFLQEFSKMLWATPYIDIAAKTYAEKDHYDFLANFSANFSKMSWANKPVESLEGKTWVDIAAKIYVERDPANFLYYFSKMSWANEPVESLEGKTWKEFAIEKLNDKKRASENTINVKLTKLARALRSLKLQKESAELLKIIE